jgi:hypothetical protein
MDLSCGTEENKKTPIGNRSLMILESPQKPKEPKMCQENTFIKSEI